MPRHRAPSRLLVLSAFLLTVTSSHSLAAVEIPPVGVFFHKDTLYRSDARGDNWCLTWAADDSQITSMCDGNWLAPGGDSYHNHLYRITGGPDGFRKADIPGYPQFVWGTGSWFGYGIVSVDGDLYSVISKTPANRWSGPFRGIKLLKSPDNGQTWYRVNRNDQERKTEPTSEARNEVNDEEMFFLEEFGLKHDKQPAYPFSFIDFVKCGSDNAPAKDEYVYIYAPEGAHAHKLLLARVHKSRIGVRSEWKYFVRYEDGQPVWTSDIHRRGYVHVFPEKNRDGHYFGWYSWLPSVVWNGGTGLLYHGQRRHLCRSWDDITRPTLLRRLDAYADGQSGFLVC